MPSHGEGSDETGATRRVAVGRVSDRRFAALVGIGAALAADGATYAGFDALRALVTRGHWVLYVYVGVFVFLATYCGAFVAWRLARRLPAAAPLPRGALLFLGFVAVYLTTGLGRIDSYDGEMMFRVDEAIVEFGHTVTLGRGWLPLALAA